MQVQRPESAHGDDVGRVGEDVGETQVVVVSGHGAKRYRITAAAAIHRPEGCRSVPDMDSAPLGRGGESVSRLCLGTMNFGAISGAADAQTIMDAAHARVTDCPARCTVKILVAAAGPPLDW